MPTVNENKTYHFSGEKIPNFRGIPGLIYSPLPHQASLDACPFYPSLKRIEVTIKEEVLPDYCQRDLIYRALASLEKNPQQDALVAALKDYAKPRKKWIDVDSFKEPVAAFITSVPLVSSFPFVTIAIGLSLPLLTSSFIIAGCLLGLLAASAVVFIIGVVLNIKLIELVGRYLNRDRLTPERQQILGRKLEGFIESSCINEKTEKTETCHPASEVISSHAKRDLYSGIHFFSPASEEESSMIQPTSASVLPPMLPR